MAAFAGDPKKKSANVDQMPRDGLTGMGFQTKKHFVEVKQKMDNYLLQQQEFEYDQGAFHPQERHRKHPLDLAFLDGKRATKPQSSASTSTSAHKGLAHLGVDLPNTNRHLGLASPNTNRHLRKPSPKPPKAAK